ncbi:sulfurtransferase TusA family protein [Synechococcus sp. PCC 6312]|uniref:sulfurtransferase TusA family protein n=1 Tax=Synechococcus sp. (strain ATCC 27167 / PCC 6312) TaxID=195253 RepID=UPI00029F0A07|nr:sulfurtransferase TusA family protein [Synechococcus sp. PCC 6312]AFY59778.1 putative redox protein, regulator of disulfide bond formation [Synechococcus sp. PCC 6312]
MNKSIETLDLRGTPCPLNFVRTKLRLQQLPPDQVLDVWLDAGEPIEQVPDSLRMGGYVIHDLQAQDDFYCLSVSRPDNLA